MKKVIGIILIIVGIITLTRIDNSGGIETIGGFIGVSLVTFLPAFLLLRKEKNENSNEEKDVVELDKIGENLSESLKNLNKSLELTDEIYWPLYKKNHPEKANDIEKLTGLNFASLRGLDAMQKIQSIERWANNLNCSIPDLKKEFIKSVEAKFSYDELDLFINRSKEEQIREASQFNIFRKNTISSFMEVWLNEYIEEKKKAENKISPHDYSWDKSSDISEDDEILNTFINFLADSESEEEASEKFLGYISDKKSSPLMKNTIMDNIRNEFNNEAENYLSENINMETTMLGLLLKAHIIHLMESYKENGNLLQLSTLDKSEYEQAITDIAMETLDKYFEQH